MHSFLKRCEEVWMDSTGERPDVSPAVIMLWRNAVTKALPTPVQDRLEDVVGLDTKSMEEWREYIIHLGPLSLRPMQMWLNSLHLDTKWHRHRKVRVSQHCLHSLSPDGRAHGRHPIPPGDRHRRCMSLRVGCSAAGQDCSGSVVCPGGCTPCQRARASGCAACTHALSTPTGGQACACSFGQHVHCCPDSSPF